MMHLRSLVLFLLFFPRGARRCIRINGSHDGAQQQKNTLANGHELLAEAREALIPVGFGTGVFRHAGLQAGAWREGSTQAGRRAGHLESQRAASWSCFGPLRANIALQAGGGPESEQLPSKEEDGPVSFVADWQELDCPCSDMGAPDDDEPHPGVGTPPGSINMEDSGQLAGSVMRDVYGDWGVAASGWVPKPLPASEAGPSPSGQRRYLWVDAFGVLNFVSIAQWHLERHAESEAKACLRSAEALIEAVHKCLGNPRSDDFPMRPAASGGHEGLRIGKERARSVSDPGMEFDGMYWHYLDKWIFALARYARAASDASAVHRGIRLVKEVHPRFLARGGNGEPLGLYWKMNVDLTTIPGRERAGPSQDAVAGLIAYTALELARVALSVEEAGNLKLEIAELKSVVRNYAIMGGFQMATDDPLGFGLQFWESQFYGKEHSDSLRRELGKVSGRAINMCHFSLPFRLYGALLGAQLGGPSSAREAAAAVELLKRCQVKEMATKCGQTEHSGINKVMFASALLPTAFRRLPEEVLLEP